MANPRAGWLNVQYGRTALRHCEVVHALSDCGIRGAEQGHVEGRVWEIWATATQDQADRLRRILAPFPWVNRITFELGGVDAAEGG